MTAGGYGRRIIAGLAAAAVAAPLAALIGVAPAEAADGDSLGSISVTIPGDDNGEDQGEGAIVDAELRWGLTDEASAGAFAGGCNFLSAGKAGDTGKARPWEKSDGFYKPASGKVEIVKATSSGSWKRASWGSKCLDRSGQEVSTTSQTLTESMVSITGGRGEAGTDGVEIAWKGSFTVAFYGGMTYWSASDPRLEIDASGGGNVTADLSGYATSRDDMSQWKPVSKRNVVIAKVTGARGDGKGFAVEPTYLGVRAAVDGQAERSSDNAETWGAFPAGFLRFMDTIGQAGYWMSTGGQRDRYKPATTLYVSYDAQVPVAPKPSSDSASPSMSAPVNNAALGARPASAASMGGGPVTGRDDSQLLRTAPAAAAPVTAKPAFSPTDVETTSLVRGDGHGLIPEGQEGPGLSLPWLVTAMGALTAVLASMRLAGLPIVPLARRRP